MKVKVYKNVLALAAVISVLVGSSINASAEGLRDVFDADYYAEQNPDIVAVLGSDPEVLLNHFVTYGVNEGRQGMASFNVSEYKNAYVDLQETLGDNWDAYVEHYFKSGVNENRIAGVYGTVTRMENAGLGSAAQTVTPNVPSQDLALVDDTSTIDMENAGLDSAAQTVTPNVPSQDSVLVDDASTVYEQVYNKIAALDINNDAAVRELDNYIRANINAIIDGEWGWKGSVDFDNGNALIIENQRLDSEDSFSLVLEIADSNSIYRGIYCYGGYSKIYSWDRVKKSSLNRYIYTNGMISEVTE